MDKITVSIITTAYNSARTIADTIESVLRQTYQDIDYWIVDGQSTDNTIEIVRSYECLFKGRLHWISEKDQGIYDAMNKGISHCTGDIVGILNSDDFFTSDDVIGKMVDAFADDIDAVYGDVHFVRSDNLDKCIRYYSGRIFKPALVKYGFIAPHPSFYIRKTVIDQYGAYDAAYQISADFELIARLCYTHRIRTRYLHLDFVTMRVGGASTRNFRARLLGAKENLVACRNLGIKTNHCMIFLKYAIKIGESIFIRH